MLYKDLKAEYRLLNDGDDWGACMLAWFDVAEWLDCQGYDIPDHWEYRAPMRTSRGSGSADCSYWWELFAQSDGREVTKFGNLLCRYARALRHAGKDY